MNCNQSKPSVPIVSTIYSQNKTLKIILTKTFMSYLRVHNLPIRRVSLWGSDSSKLYYISLAHHTSGCSFSRPDTKNADVSTYLGHSWEGWAIDSQTEAELGKFLGSTLRRHLESFHGALVMELNPKLTTEASVWPFITVHPVQSSAEPLTIFH